MAKVASEHIFTGDTVAYNAYDSTKTTLGHLIVQKSGLLGTDNWAGPAPIGLCRAFEVSSALAGLAYPHVLTINDTIDWVFLGDISTAAATRRVTAIEYNKSTQTFSWRGYITLTYPVATNHTTRALRVSRHNYSTGTVAVSGTAVTGTTTAWQTARFAVGARIGFGSTNPENITTWYYISAIGSDTGITLSASAGTIAGGTAYVIDELRVITLTTNATATNGGLFVAKGVNFDDFSATGTVISAAVSTDNIKAVYWLKDASTETNTIGAGIGFVDAESNTSHNIYTLNADTTTTMRVFKYNIRAALTVSTGASTDAFVIKTGVSGTLTGTISQTNNGRHATTSHGPGSGVPSIYFVTTTRIYRIQESLIQDTLTNFITDGAVEIPPGGTNTYAASAALGSIEYASAADAFIVTTTGGATKQYMTKYNTNGDPFNYVWGVNTLQIDQSSADSGTTPHPSFLGLAFSVWSQGGICYICRNGTTAANLHLYAVPFAADWNFASSAPMQRLITPSMSTQNAVSLYRAYVSNAEVIGSDNLGTSPEPYRIYARVSGISDDSGSWTRLSGNYDLTSFAPTNEIQFMFEFRLFGLTCVPARIYSCAVVYEDDSTDSHYQPSVAHSDTATSAFAWRFAVSFGGAVPDLRVRLYNAITGELLADDNTDDPIGTFERSTNDGGAWSAWNNTDKGNETTYLRYTPVSLAASVTIRALLTQL